MDQKYYNAFSDVNEKCINVSHKGEYNNVSLELSCCMLEAAKDVPTKKLVWGIGDV